MVSARVYPEFNRRGFTLTELTIVIAIIAILTAGMISAINIPEQLKRTRDGTRKSDLRIIQSALEIYRTDQRSYPTTAQYAAVACGASLTGGSPPSTYLQKKLCDPKNSGQYIYNYTSGGTTYTLVSCLERYSDPQRDASNNATYCGGTTNWSYTLQNP